MMYGKCFKNMYDGSMYGAGIAVFAVWGYAIANADQGCVELNPKRVADTLGGSREEVIEAIKFLERPDPDSRHKEHGGSRLVREGEFQYLIPSWATYQALKNAESLREANRDAKRRQRLREEEEKAKQRELKRRTKEAKLAGKLAGANEALVKGFGSIGLKSEAPTTDAPAEQDRDDCPL